MHRLQEEIQDFNAFANDQLSRGANITSLDELYDCWREHHPAVEDALAVQASIRDMENGERGRPFSEFAADFEQRNRIADDQ